MHLNLLIKKRFFIYIQIAVIFVGATYLLFRHDKLRVPSSWGIPHSSVEPGLVDPIAHAPTTTGAAGGDHSTVELPSPVPAPNATDNAAGHDGSLPASDEDELSGEKDEGWEQPNPSDKAHEDKSGQDAEGEPKADEKEGVVENEVATAESPTTGTTEEPADSSPSASPTAAPKPTKEELTDKARTYIPSILDPNDTSIDRMYCPPINATRYTYLQASPSPTSSPGSEHGKPRYFVAINLRKCVDLLPRLLGSLLQTINFLGPAQCAVSIVEGNSDDGTLEVLELLAPELERMGVPYFLRTTPLNPAAGLRIDKLAMLRAMALTPITGVHVPDTDPDSPDFPSAFPSSVPELALAEEEHNDENGGGATVLFLNDVAACPDDMLELLHQRVLQRADMTCAMDWTHVGQPPTFYDVWVSRALNGDLFFDIPADPVTWARAHDLFWNEPVARARYAARKPFQVFACWNGAVAFTARPVVEREVWFRAARAGECFQGEPQLFCKDLWYKGYGRIMVVPGVNLEYTDELGRRTKEEKGYVGDWIADEAEERNGTGLMVPWKSEPPETTKCMPTFPEQFWVPWNESLPLM